MLNGTIKPLRIMLFTAYWLLVDKSIARAYVGYGGRIQLTI